MAYPYNENYDYIGDYMNRDQVNGTANQVNALLKKSSLFSNSGLTTTDKIFNDESGIISTGLSAIPVVGTAASLVFKGLGLANSAFGKKATNAYIGDRTFNSSGFNSPRNNYMDLVDKGAGQKFGIFSEGQRKKLNTEIRAERTRNMGLESYLNRIDRNFEASNSSLQNALSQNQQRFSGTNMFIQRVQFGGKIKNLAKIAKSKEFRNLVKNATKSKDKISFEEYFKTVPNEKNDTTLYDLRKAYELAPYKDMIRFAKDPEFHLNTVYKDSNNIYNFVKHKDHPTLYKELDWYNSNDPDAIEFKKEYDLDTSKDYYKYIPRNKNTQSFKEGGELNVIVEGALHKNKHNMDVEYVDDITDKGVPVVSFEDGNVIQHAEVEGGELILIKDITEEIEKLRKLNTEESMIEAGKLLVKEILNNTVDNSEKLLENA